jgi:hypothetical protein
MYGLMAIGIEVAAATHGEKDIGHLQEENIGLAAIGLPAETGGIGKEGIGDDTILLVYPQQPGSF